MIRVVAANAYVGADDRRQAMSVYRLDVLAGSDSALAEFKARDDAAAREGAREVLSQVKEAAGAVLWRRDQARRTLVRIGVVPFSGAAAAPAGNRAEVPIKSAA